MSKGTIKGLTIGKNLIAMGLSVMSLIMAGVGIKILFNDLSYMSILELIQYLTYGAMVMLAAEGVKNVRIK